MFTHTYAGYQFDKHVDRKGVQTYDSVMYTIVLVLTLFIIKNTPNLMLVWPLTERTIRSHTLYS